MKRKRNDPVDTVHIQTAPIEGALEIGLVDGMPKHVKPHPKGMFPLHFTQVYVGRCGSGKTNCALQLIKQYLDHESFSKAYWVSPTADETGGLKSLKLPIEDIYNYDRIKSNPRGVIDEILTRIKADSNLYDRNEEYKKIYAKYIKIKNSKLEWYELQSTLGPAEFRLLREANFGPPLKLPFPSPLVVLDDLSHSNVYDRGNSNTFINLLLRHRHVWHYGLSIIMMAQNFKSIPKALRQNISQYFLWQTHDSDQLDDIYREIALCTKEDFMKLYTIATSEDHDFLSVDIPAPEGKHFRHNFKEYLIPQLEPPTMAK